MKLTSLFAAVVAIALGVSPALADRVAFYDFEQNLNDFGASPPLDMVSVGSLSFSSNTPTSGVGYAFGGNSLQFASSNSYGYVTPGANLKLELPAFTVEAWVNLSAPTQLGYIFAYVPRGASSDGRGYALSVNQGRVRLDIGTADGLFDFVESTTTLSANTWYHVAGSFEGGVGRVFVNGVQENDDLLGAIVYADLTGRGPNPKTAYIGINHNANDTSPTFAPDLFGSYPENSLIDRLMIHNVAFEGVAGNGSIAPQLDYFAVPEPSALLLLGLGALLLPGRRFLPAVRRRRGPC